MNNISTDTHMIYSEHRKIAISFRDKILLDIFKLGMQCLTQIYGPNNAWPANLHDRLKDHALELCKFVLKQQLMKTRKKIDLNYHYYYYHNFSTQMFVI